MATRDIDREEPVKADPRIKRYTLADGSQRYMARYRHADGSQSKKRGFSTIPEARRWLEGRNVDARGGREVKAAAGRTTVADLWPAFHARKATRNKASSLGSLESSWHTHVKPRWGKAQVSKVRASDVQEWVGGLQRTRRGEGAASPSIVIRAAGVLRGILDIAVRDKRIVNNPLDDVELPRKPKGKKATARRYLSHEEVDRLAQAVEKEDGDRAAIIYIVCYMGPRFGEVNGFQIEDWVSMRRRLYVNRAWTQNRSGAWHLDDPKSYEKRSLVAPEFIAKRLDALVEGKKRGDRLFVRHAGDMSLPLPYPGKANGWREASWLERGLKAAELDRLTMHDLRHTAASLAVQAGANVKALQRMFGHESAAETLDTYADLFDEDLEAVARSLENERKKRLKKK